MPPGSELLIALLVPAALLVALRINAALVFLSLCLGQVLVQTISHDADSVLHMAMPKASAMSSSTLEVILLLAPAIATAIIMLFSIHGRARTVMNIIPALAAAALGVLLVEGLLTPAVQTAIESSNMWHQFARTQSFVVGIGAALSLMFLWSQRRGAKHDER